jgi:selT/selW/selH-like putative selenoprotein
VAESLLETHQHEFESLTLVPSSGGVFVVECDDEVVFSKKEAGRHATPEEIVDLVEQRL